MTSGPLRQVAGALASAEDLESVVRPILELLADAGGLDTTYLTTWDRANGLQEWRFVHTVRGPAPWEGGTWPWAEVLCNHLIEEGRSIIPDVGASLPDHPSHTLLGVRGFVSVPYTLVGRGTEVAGTLCGSSLDPIEPDNDVVHLFHLGAKLIADRMARDIDLGRERLRADAAERRFHERVRMMAATQHTLRTPLSLVSGWAAALAENYDTLDERERIDGLRRITEAAGRLQRDLEGVLHEASATLLGADLHPTALPLGEFLLGLIDSHGADEHRITIRAGTIIGTALVDQRALEQVVEQLLDNATRHAPGCTVTISARAEERTVVVRVEDDGPGLPYGIDVFAPFTRGHEVKASDSTGLGMHIVRTLVEASGGTVQADAPPTGGTRIEFTLPRA